MSQEDLYNGDCLEELKRFSPNSVDAIVTDPPYELNFMGNGWDNAGVSFQKETWGKCLRVLKPGGYLLAFGGTRTYHRIACAIEDAGFEIRDCIMWLYGSGFPKSMNIGKKLPEWQGWGTVLKPAYEPIIMARKPFKGGVVGNIEKYGVGGININECRVPAENIEEIYRKPSVTKQQPAIRFNACKIQGSLTDDYLKGRFPANVLLDTREGEEWRRYFYCSKASKKDRDEGLEEFEKDITDDGRNKPIDNPYLRGKTMRHNTHPTVKPTTLMQYLIRLVAPKGSTILDPFMGSGSTGKAVMYENKERNANYKFIGIEKDGEYCKIAEARIKHAGGEE
jgi:site-specific DNA-methyltransferase (adenine-specific)